MSNVLQYSLGLASGGFISSLGRADSALKGFGSRILSLAGPGAALGGLIGSVTSVGAIFENVFKQFEKGAGLAALSKQTGATVADIYSLQRGFIAAHVSADLVGSSIFMMQKALGGVSEMGESTKDVFSRLGLNETDLTKMGPAKAIEAITTALGKMNNSQAAKDASVIFGRGGAREMLQIARSGEEFSRGIKDAAEQAALFQKNAASFEKIDMSIVKLKTRFNGLFAGIADGAGPGIQQLLDKLNKIDLSGIGKTIGTWFAAIPGIIQSQNLGELFRLTLTVGFEGAVNVLFGLLQKVAAGFPGMMSAAMSASASVADIAKAAFYDVAATAGYNLAKDLPATDPARANLLANARENDAKADAYRASAANQRQQAVSDAAQSVVDGMGANTVSLFGSGSGDALKELLKKYKPAPSGEKDKPKTDPEDPFGMGGKVRAFSHQDTNALERIGLVRLGNTGISAADRTAQNTKDALGYLKQITDYASLGHTNNGDHYFTNY